MPEKFVIFIVEDEPFYGGLLKHHLSANPDHEVHLLATARECLDRLPQQPGLITLDYSLPDANGMDLFKRIRSRDPQVPIIVVSGQEDVGAAIQLLKAGASDYFVKDEHTRPLLWNAVLRIRKQRSLEQEVAFLRGELDKQYDLVHLLKGNSAAMQQVHSLVRRSLHTNINVSITGETGTGKEVVAKAIHFNSNRKQHPFVAINMGAIPRELLESELFGYEQGAFTGAMSRKIGKFEEANKGTLFLDEIGEMEGAQQSKLLRVLQERELTRIGGKERIPLDVRLIVATNRDLTDGVRTGAFREDLYYRLIGLPIRLPPLRERESDILLLAKHFLAEFCMDNHRPLLGIGTDAMDKLLRYHYPGNVRELKAVIQLAAVLCEGPELGVDNILFTAVRRAGGLLDEEKTLREYERDIILHFLRRYDNNVVRTSERLGIGKSKVYAMLQSKEILRP